MNRGPDVSNVDQEMLVVISKGDDNSFYSASMDVERRWLNKVRVEDGSDGVPGRLTSSSSPGVVMFRNRLYLAFKGAENELWLAWNDGYQWRGSPISSMPGGLRPKSSLSPNLAVFRRNICAVYKSWSGTELYMATFDGTTWSGDKPILGGNGNMRSTSTPGICVYQDNLYLIYKAWKGNVLYYASFDGEKWSGDKPIVIGGDSPRSNHSPRLCAHQGYLYTVYQDSSSNVLFMAYFNGDEWLGNQPISVEGSSLKSESSPGMAEFSRRLYLVYRGLDRPSLLSASTFAGIGWVGNEFIKDRPYGIDIQSNENPNICVRTPPPRDESNWMSNLADSMPIGDISLPGTHDSAAINTYATTPYACQNYSISDQLKYGIRALDVRLKVKRVSDPSMFRFITCHGNKGSRFGSNEYESFPSLMTKCKLFLNDHDREAIIMSLKVDDWTDITAEEKPSVYTVLGALLDDYKAVRMSTIPSLLDVRGKIFIINRIEDADTQSIYLGAPFDWPYNTIGAEVDSVPMRHYKIWVQDKYEKLEFPEEETKTDLAIYGFSKYQAGRPVLNFANATTYKLFGVYINERLLRFFGRATGSQRPANLGWLMLDYALDGYKTTHYGVLNVVSMVIESNFGYKRFPEGFGVYPWS